MSFEIVYGDVFDKIEVPTIIAHGCNTRGVMGSGIALTIKNKFPGAYRKYRDEYEKTKKQFPEEGPDYLDLGQVIFHYENPSLIIANCITQILGGDRPMNYVAIIESMKTVIKQTKGIYEVRFPLIGGGLGGGNPKTLVDIYSDLFNNIVVGKLYLLKEASK